MRISQPAHPSFSPVVSMEGATRFGPILSGLAKRLGSKWYLEASRTCDGKSILLAIAAPRDVDLTMTVTETASGFLIEELEADQLRRVGECQTLDQVSALVTHYTCPSSSRLSFAFTVYSAAA